jgi:hypothetical protein
MLTLSATMLAIIRGVLKLTATERPKNVRFLDRGAAFRVAPLPFALLAHDFYREQSISTFALSKIFQFYPISLFSLFCQTSAQTCCVTLAALHVRDQRTS